MSRIIIGYQVVDGHTGNEVRYYEVSGGRVASAGGRASRLAEARNQEYGAHRYYRCAVWLEVAAEASPSAVGVAEVCS